MNTDLMPLCSTIRAQVDASGVDDFCTLRYDDRQLRDAVLATDAGEQIHVELTTETAVRAGDALELADGRLIVVRAASESLMEITGDGLLHIAWRLGRENVLCQILGDRILVKQDAELRRWVAGSGAKCRDVVQPFEPEPI